MTSDATAASKPASAPHDRLADRVILVVDDDDDIRSSFEFAVRAEGAEVRSASDGNMAISETNDGEVDAVIPFEAGGMLRNGNHQAHK